MPRLNNSAGRLYIILHELISQASNTQLLIAWAKVLCINDKDESLIYDRKDEVSKLVRDTKAQIAIQQVDQQLYLKPFIGIQRAVALHLNYKVSNVIEHVTPEVMAQLEFCDELLARNSLSNIEVDISEFQALEKSIVDIRNTVLGADLPSDLRFLLLKNINDLHDAIRNYRIHGLDGIRDALDTALGSAVSYKIQEHSGELSDEAEDTFRDYLDLIEKFFSVLVNSGAVALVASNAVTTFLTQNPSIQLPSG